MGELLVAAWSSRHALKLLPVTLLASFSVISVPLVEAPRSRGEFLSYLAPSALAVPPALLVLFGLWFVTYRRGNQPVWMLFLVASTAGAVRGASLFAAGELLGPTESELPSLLARVLTAVATWNLTLGSFAIINYLVLSPTERLYKLRRELLELDEEIGDSKLRLEWLVNRKVKGLEQELRQEFLALSEALKRDAAGADGSYAELAKALREFASRSVRDRSRQMWRAEAGRNHLIRAATGAITKNPLVISSAVIYLLGYLINEIRVYGFSIGLLSLALGSLSFLLLVLAGQSISRKLSNNLAVSLSIAFSQGVISALLYLTLLPERTTEYVVATSVTAVLWALASLFLAGWLKLSIDLYASELSELSRRRELSEAELGWLESQVESSNREISKYLHGILQSRLMAHALSLEGRGSEPPSDVDEILRDLERIMASPMDAFFASKGDLTAELDHVSKRWAGFIEVNFVTLDVRDQSLTEPTMQVLQEALSNGFRHGGATRAEVSIVDSASSRELTVIDNGVLASGNSGLGSEIIASLTQSRWSIEASGSGSVFRAQLPL